MTFLDANDMAARAKATEIVRGTSQGQRDAEQARSLETIGRNAYESIVEMVAALECDYELMSELKSDIESHEETLRQIDHGDMTEDYPDDDLRAEYRDEVQSELDGLREELKELSDAAGDCTSREDAEQRIQEDPLSVEVRSGWVPVGEIGEAEEFCILLGTGGPAVRIRGELGEYNEPRRAWLETQDWGTPWTQYFGASQETLLTYCRQFYFGE
jgi:hypothetical protein